MDLFARLEEEHTLITAVMDALDGFVESFLASGNVNFHELIRFLTFLRGYADGLHHEREETVLLPALGLAGFPPDSAPLGHIRDQHREEGRLLLGIAKAACAPEPWDKAQIALVASCIRGFTAFERTHMSKERELLFPVARKELASHKEALATAVARFERTREPRFDRPWLEQLGRALADAHRPSR